MKLDLQLESVWCGETRVKQLDQHSEVVSELRVQTLQLAHLLVVKDIASVHVHEKVVLQTEQLNFDDFWAFIGTLNECNT